MRRHWVILLITVLALVLRIWHVNRVPVSLFGDELDVGYQAFSILKTGRDYSGNLLPFDFQGIAEWRTPLYLYSAVPTVALFGISSWGVRLPAVIFGVLTVPLTYFLTRELTNSKKLGIISSLLLAISPWHLQYSRAGFEVTELIFLLVAGLLLFFESIKNKGSYLWLSASLLVLTAWTYNTAKLFTPLFILVLIFLYRKEILKFNKLILLKTLLVSLLLSLPLLYSTFFGGGSQRIGDINIFKVPLNETLISQQREMEKNPYLAKIFTNKITLYGAVLLKNYITPFSSDFLFLNGDTNPRHSIEGMGEFYKIEAIAIVSGLGIFFTSTVEKRKKILLLLWIILSVLPSSVTIGGEVHATRLILLLVPLIVIVSFGWELFVNLFRNKAVKSGVIFSVFLIYVLSFISYEHMYWVENPIQSEKWWHYGWEEAIKEAVNLSANYENVIISTRGEPPWIFFAAWSQFDPDVWHKGYPLKKHIIDGFGEVSFIQKYSFGSPQNGGVYDWGKVISSNILYIADAREINVDFLHNKETLPQDLSLIKTVVYPSGSPAFYLLTHKK